MGRGMCAIPPLAHFPRGRHSHFCGRALWHFLGQQWQSPVADLRLLAQRVSVAISVPILILRFAGTLADEIRFTAIIPAAKLMPPLAKLNG